MIKRLILIFSITSILISCEQPPVEQTVITNDNGEVQNTLETQVIKNCNLQSLGLNSELGTPKTITEAVDLINALPKPVTIPCFLEALNRPLRVYTTSSVISVQPAVGSENPRIFIFSGDSLIISLVPQGYGAVYVEFGQLVNSSKSIKAELEFPINASIDYKLAFDRINKVGKTSCGGCHKSEVLDTTQTGINTEIYISAAVKPKLDKVVYLDDFWKEHYNCAFTKDTSQRCKIINALFGHGVLRHQEFPADMPDWFESMGF